MGGGPSKDPNIDIYVQTQKPFYYAGQMLEGIVYLNVKAPSNYNALYIRFQGHEYCYWSQGSGKNRRSYTGSKQIYKDEYLLSKFTILNVGHYAFPFSFILPRDLVGSYLHNGNTNTTIYYPLKGVLINYQDSKNNQQYGFNLTIIEPLRVPQSPTSGFSQINPTVCCCLNQGQSSLKVDFSSNASTPGQKVQVAIYVNNRNCKKNIDCVSVRLNNHVFKTSNSGTYRNHQTPLSVQNSKPVSAFSQQKLNFQVNIPNITNSTAIGSLVGNYYTLDVSSEMSGCLCCSATPYVFEHLYLNALTPQVPVKPTLNPPPNWNPVFNNKIVFTTNFRTIYNKNPNLAIMNR